MKLFGKWDHNVEIKDLGLKKYINIDPKVIPKTCGRTKNKPIIEKFINHLMVPGHKGKKHKITSGRCCGNYMEIYKIVKKSFDIIAEKTKKNPLEVFIRGIENAAPYELTVSQQIGGIIARKPAICSPIRRLNLALRRLTQGSYSKAFNSKKKIEEAIAEEIINAYKNSNESFAIQERIRNEKEAEGAR
ncbi:MAG: 30S ribosomal protein S7 [Candidatus Aenigmarchaeota archaeon ex4484_56]|nr:MAG: 30S ribosomal protein S7 [Candidatus Aenigmarchaeota archaeon ex4484_56]